MELVIILIVLTLIVLVIIGPAGFFKAIALGVRLNELQREVDRLAAELQEARSLSLLLYDRQRAGQTEEASERETATQPKADPPAEEAASAITEPAPPPDKAPVAQTPEETTPEPPAGQETTTLQHLLGLRQQHRTDQALEEPADKREDDEAKAPATEEAKPFKPVEQAVEEKPAGPAQPAIATSVASEPRVETDKPDEAPARRLTIEEVLAGKVFVWIGAIALVLTAAFLLKLGFDSGIITEPVRVIAAAVFGLALWAVGEWTRSRVGLISQALCGAAVAVLYASVLAAHSLYGLFGTGGGTIAFGLMATITAAAILLSLRHGPAVAILGMLGGFMLPPVLNQGLGSPTAGMVLYLVAIEVGVLAVTGKRGWFGISLMTLIFSVAWSIGYTLIGDDPHERTLTALLVIGTAAAYLFHTARIHRDPAATRRRVLGLSIAAICSAIGVTALLVLRGDFSMQDLGMLWFVAAGTLALARIDARQIAMPFVAMGLTLMVLLSNALVSLPAPPSGTLITMAAAFGGLFLLGGYACLWGNQNRRVFATMCAIAGPSFYGLVVFAGHDAYGWREAWWPFTFGLALLYALAALPLLLRRKAEHDWPIALFSVLSFVLVCVTLGQSMDHPRFAVCLALVSAAAALIDLRLFIRPLRLAACTAAFGSAALLVAPGPFDLAIQGGPIFNTLLPMYALPAFAFGVIACAAKRAGSETTARHLTWLCMATLCAMLLVLTRDIFQPKDFIAEAFGLYEWSTYATVLLLTGYLTTFVAVRVKYSPILDATRLIVGIGAILALVGGLIPGNPLFNSDVTGGYRLALGLLALYALPAALLWHWSSRQPIATTPMLASALRVVAITLIAVFVGLQIRNGFAPDGLRGDGVLMTECIAYAVAWLLLGGLLQHYNQQRLQNYATRVAGQLVFGLGLATTLVGSLVYFNPLIDQGAVGGWGLVWRLAVLYIVPAVLMWLWSRGKTLSDQPRLITMLRGTAIIYLAIFAGQLIRNAFHYADLHAYDITLFECATYGLAWVALGFALHLIAPRCTLARTTGALGRCVFGAGLATLLVGNALILNPLWIREAVGNTPVFNGLWYLYGPTILILALLARKARRQEPPVPAKLAGFMAVGLSFMLLSMLVRHGFSGDGFALITSNLEPAERYAYSLAWVLFGGTLLVAGVFTRLDTLRYGSLAVLLLAVGKVFLIDTANLENLYRVFSFFGLGVTLVGLGYLYQRLVFRRPGFLQKAAQQT